MKELSSLDLYYLIKEMKFLEGARIDKIVQPSKEDIIFQFYITNKGKQMLKITPYFIYLTSKKPATAEKLFGFCSGLRKYLSNARLETIKQINSERIVEFVFKTKDEQYSIIIELFARGNVILCKKDLTIIVPLKSSKIKGRHIKAGVKYVYPKRDVDFFQLTLPKLKNIIKKSDQTTSKTLAVDIGLGGQYAKEICSLAGVDEKSKTLDEQEIKKLLDALKLLINRKKEEKRLFSSEIEIAAESREKKTKTKHQKELERLQKIIDTQERKISELKSSVEENKKKGELIYEKYQLLNEVIDEIKKAREKHGWKEIKEKLKGHKLVKDVNDKTGEIIIELK